MRDRMTDEPISQPHMPPLPAAATKSVRDFQTYLKRHHLEPLRVALASGVRYATIWNIQHGKPIQPCHAVAIRMGLHTLTGEVYTAAIHVLGEGEQGDRTKRQGRQA